jgi:hypothetical protein
MIALRLVRLIESHSEQLTESLPEEENICLPMLGAAQRVIGFCILRGLRETSFRSREDEFCISR